MKWLKNKIIWFLSVIGILGVAAAATIDTQQPLGGLSDTETQKIRDFQDNYYQQHGEYFQIRRGQKLPTDATDRMKSYAKNKLKLNVTKDFRVHVYEYPDGTKGYKIQTPHIPDPNLIEDKVASST